MQMHINCKYIYFVLVSRLYWMDLYKDTIESSDLNGENHLVLASESDSPGLADIVIHGQYLYYTAWHRQ